MNTMRNSNHAGDRNHCCAAPLCLFVYLFVVPFVCLSAPLPTLVINEWSEEATAGYSPFSLPPFKNSSEYIGQHKFKSKRTISYNSNCPGVDWDNCKLFFSRSADIVISPGCSVCRLPPLFALLPCRHISLPLLHNSPVRPIMHLKTNKFFQRDELIRMLQF